MGSLDPNDLYLFEREGVWTSVFWAEHNGKEYILYAEDRKVVSFCWDKDKRFFIKNE